MRKRWMSTRRIFSPAIEQHPRDPGANMVIGRHGFKFVLVTFEKFGRHRGQPWAKSRFKKKERIYLPQEFLRYACHHPGWRLDEQIALRKYRDLGFCIEVSQHGQFAPSAANFPPVIGNQQASPA